MHAAAIMRGPGDRSRLGRLLTGPWAAGLLLALHVVLAVDSSRHDSCTFDELAFITGGASHVLTGDYRLAPDGGQLAQRWMALPFLFTDVKFPPLDHPAWATSGVYVLGMEFFHASGNDPSRLLQWARMQVLVLSVLAAIVTWAWARRLFGATGGIVALALHALSPLFLSHGRLATADMAAALFFLVSTWACWEVMARVTVGRLLASMAAASLLFAAKLSAVLLLPIAGALLLARLASSRPLRVDLPAWRGEYLGPGRKFVALLPVLLLHVAAVVFSLWAILGFRYEAALDAPRGTDVMRDGGWEAMKGAGWADGPVSFAREHRLLPEAWLFGFQYVVKHSREREAYALGRYGMKGWWWYFPVSLVLKSPLGTLAIAVLAACGIGMRVLDWRRRVHGLPDAAPPDEGAASPFEMVPLIALIVVYGATAVTTSLNIGVRHVLPIVPPLFILCGAAALLIPRWRGMAAGLGVLVALSASETLFAHPHHLAHMNAFGGAPERRWRRLVDSSLDWGQGLGSLRESIARWRADGLTDPVYLGYFGTSDPLREGLDVRLLPGHVIGRDAGFIEPLVPGAYCVSATVLVQVYSRFPGTWAAPYEERWQEIRHLERHPGQAADLASDPAGAQRLADWHAGLRMARLCAYLRHRPPDEAIDGGSILAWRLTAEDLERALHGPPAELAEQPVLSRR